MTKTEAPPRQSWTTSEWTKIRAANDVSQFVPETPAAEEPGIYTYLAKKPVAKQVLPKK